MSSTSELSGLGSYLYWVYFIIVFIIFVIHATRVVVARHLNVNTFRNFRLSIVVGSFLVFFFFSNSIISHRDVCGTTDYSKAFLMCFFPFIFIFGIGSLLLEMFPGWIRGFSNTFGLSVSKLSNLTQKLQGIIKDGSNELGRRIYSDPIPLFKEMTLKGYVENDEQVNWSSLSNLTDNNNMFKNSAEISASAKRDIARHLFIKDSVSYFIWYMMLGIITLQSTIIMIINDHSCAKQQSDNKSFTEYLKS